MPDLSAGWDTPNPYGLLASDFAYDVTGYQVALRFLSDLAGGTEGSRALEINGGSVAQLRAWEASGKFRRVLAKCRAAGDAERAARAAQEAQEATLDEGKVNPPGQVFVPLEDAPVNRGVFTLNPPRGSYGAPD